MSRNRRRGGEQAYIDVEMIEVIEKFQALGDYNTIRKASHELAVALKQSNFLLRDNDDVGGWGGDFMSMNGERKGRN